MTSKLAMDILHAYFGERIARTAPAHIPGHSWDDFMGFKVVWIDPDSPVTEEEVTAKEVEYGLRQTKMEDVVKWAHIRPIRNRLLEITDWTEDPNKNGNLSVQAKADSIVDRQALRDITSQSNSRDVTWPERLESTMENDILIGIFMGKN